MKTQKIRKVISVLVAMGIVTAVYAPSFAEESKPSGSLEYDEVCRATILKDSSERRIAQTNDEDGVYTTTYDKIANTIQVTVLKVATGEVLVGNKKIIPASDTSEKIPGISLFSTVTQNTFTNFEYTIWTGSPKEWELRRPQPDKPSSKYYFRVNENSSNTSDLSIFRDAVDLLNDKEWDAVVDYGLSLVTVAASGFISGFAVASAGVLSTAAIASIVSAAGAVGNAARALIKVGNCCNDALLAYWDVYYATDNMHF